MSVERQKLDLSEYQQVVRDHGDGRALGKLTTKVFGIERPAPSDGQREDLEAQRVATNSIMHRLK